MFRPRNEYFCFLRFVYLFMKIYAFIHIILKIRKEKLKLNFKGPQFVYYRNTDTGLYTMHYISNSSSMSIKRRGWGGGRLREIV